MTGHDDLIALRLQGWAPRTVQVHTEPEVADWVIRCGWTGHIGVHIPPTDRLDSLDLRCLIGLRVLVSGPDDQRVRDVWAAVCQAKPARAIAITSTAHLDTFQ